MTINDSIAMVQWCKVRFSGFSKLSGSTFGIVHNICVLPNDFLYFVRFWKYRVVQGVSSLACLNSRNPL